jgi:hypothetical protein
MPQIFALAGLIALLWSFHNNLKWRFIAGIMFGIICIVYYERIETSGPGLIYTVIAIVMWFYCTTVKSDKH